jgi:hypothetical protein
METIIVYYQGNKDQGLEGQIKDAAKGYKAALVSDFEFDNQVFQALIKFQNIGQIENFKLDLENLGRAFKTKISIGGYIG